MRLKNLESLKARLSAFIALLNTAELYAGCVSGAIQKNEYFDIVKASGFTDLTLQKEKEIKLPYEVLAKYLSIKEIDEFNRSKSPIMPPMLKAFSASLINKL